MAKVELNVGALGRVEGDLDVRVMLEDNVVVEAWTEASMFRGFEIILKGKDPQAGLIVTPRICGICGGSHLTKAVYALDTAWRTEVPPNAHLVRNIAQACETLQSIPRWFYALFGISLVNKNYAKSSMYEEAVKRFTPFVGTSYEKGVVTSNKPVEIYALFGGQWPHSSFMVPGGVMSAPTLSDVTRATAIMEYYKNEWLEPFFGCEIDRWLENKTWADVQAWLDESPSHRDSDMGFFIRYAQDIGLDQYGQGIGRYIASGTFIEPEHYQHPTIEARNQALITRSGIYDGTNYHDFDQANVVEDHTNSYYRGAAQLHPFDGMTEPLDPLEAKKEGKYSWAKSPRYMVNGEMTSVEAGPLSRQIIAGREGALEHQDYDPLMKNIIEELGPSVMTRVIARLHEAPKYYRNVEKWLKRLDLHDNFYIKPTEHAEGEGFGGTEAARGALMDWIKIKDNKIENYQVITPTAWNIGPRDSQGQNGSIEKAMMGTTIEDIADPVELGFVAHSFDSCLVCTVHAYDSKSHKKLSQFKFGANC